MIQPRRHGAENVPTTVDKSASYAAAVALVDGWIVLLVTLPKATHRTLTVVCTSGQPLVEVGSNRRPAGRLSQRGEPGTTPVRRFVYTSAQEASPGRAKNLYAGEDHILASLPAHLAVLELDDEPGPEERGSGDSGPRRDLAELMRRFDLTIVCDTAGWTVETAPTAYDVDR